MRRAFFFGPLVVAPLAACTMLGSIDRHAVARVDSVPGWTAEIDEPPGWQWKTMLPLAGGTGSVELAHGGARLSVCCAPIAWDQHAAGPIVPIFPVLLGESAEEPYLVVELWVTASDGALELRPETVTVELAEQPRVAPRAARLEVAEIGREFAIAVDERRALRTGDVVLLEYPLENAGLQGFDVVLPADLADAPPPRISFRREHADTLVSYSPFVRIWDSRAGTPRRPFVRDPSAPPR